MSEPEARVLLVEKAPTNLNICYFPSSGVRQEERLGVRGFQVDDEETLAGGQTGVSVSGRYGKLGAKSRKILKLEQQ